MIYLNRFFVLTLFVMLFCGCGNHKKNQEIEYVDKSLKLDSLFDIHGDNLAILSCTSCSCFPDAYNSEFLKNNEKPNNYTLLADTNCNRFRFPVVHFSTREAEQISDEFYNVTLVKRRGEKKTYKILNINESDKIRSVADNFFRD